MHSVCAFERIRKVLILNFRGLAVAGGWPLRVGGALWSPLFPPLVVWCLVVLCWWLLVGSRKPKTQLGAAL